MSNQQIHDQLTRHLNFLEQDQNNLGLLVRISLLYVELEELETAQTYLDKANEIDRISCLGHQGLLHLKRGYITQATENFAEALTYDDTPALRYNLGFTHFINSEFNEAEHILSPIVDDESQVEAKLLMARIHHRNGALDKAISLAQEALSSTPDHEEAMGILALLHFDQDDEDSAFQMAERALILNPENYDANVVKTLSGLLTQTASVEDVEKLLHVNPGDCRLWFALGSVQMTQGNIKDSYESLSRALEIYPEFYDCRIAFGWCQLLADHIDEAFETYQTAANIAPDLSDSWGGIALAHALKGEFLQAEPLIAQAKNLNPECFLADIAEVICLNHTNPLLAQQHLVDALKNSNVPASEKLALIIEHMSNQPTQVH